MTATIKIAQTQMDTAIEIAKKVAQNKSAWTVTPLQTEFQQYQKQWTRKGKHTKAKAVEQSRIHTTQREAVEETWEEREARQQRAKIIMGEEVPKREKKPKMTQQESMAIQGMQDKVGKWRRMNKSTIWTRIQKRQDEDMVMAFLEEYMLVEQEEQQRKEKTKGKERTQPAGSAGASGRETQKKGTKRKAEEQEKNTQQEKKKKQEVAKANIAGAGSSTQQQRAAGRTRQEPEADRTGAGPKDTHRKEKGKRKRQPEQQEGGEAPPGGQLQQPRAPPTPQGRQNRDTEPWAGQPPTPKSNTKCKTGVSGGSKRTKLN